MHDHCLLTVEDRFLLTKIGLVVTPDFSVPEKGTWADFRSKAKIQDPNGKETEQEMHVGTWHFNIRDPEASVDKRWRVVLTFPSASKEQVPIGSRVFVSADDYRRIRGEYA